MNTNTTDWRSQLPNGSRQKMVNKIADTLKKHVPFAGTEGIMELMRIASRFEERTFSSAVNQTDYLRKISLKMLTMETRAQDAAAAPSSSTNNSLPLDLGYLLDSDSEPCIPDKEPAMNTGDWRTQLPSDSRQQNVNKLMETLKKHVPYSGQEGIDELMRIAISFEELIFNTATNQIFCLLRVSVGLLAQNIRKDADYGRRRLSQLRSRGLLKNFPPATL